MTEAWATEHFPTEEIEVQRFSEFVAGAHDHITVRRRQAFAAAGTLGSDRLVVTYGKLLEHERPVEVIQQIEALITSAFGPIQHHVPRSDVV